jgi:hypothetical protein
MVSFVCLNHHPHPAPLPSRERELLSVSSFLKGEGVAVCFLFPQGRGSCCLFPLSSRERELLSVSSPLEGEDQGEGTIAHPNRPVI